MTGRKKAAYSFILVLKNNGGRYLIIIPEQYQVVGNTERYQGD